MYTIQESINQWLIDRGVISNTASVLDNTIMLLFIILITVAIDYICGEIPQSGGENAFLTEIRLFEGWTDETGSAVYEGLKGRLERGGKI